MIEICDRACGVPCDIHSRRPDELVKSGLILALGTPNAQQLVMAGQLVSKQDRHVSNGHKGAKTVSGGGIEDSSGFLTMR